MSFTLSICSIPIGHADDITKRVKNCLSDVCYIFCEDTRVTKLFLVQQGIWHQQQLIRMDQFQEKRSFKAFDQSIALGNVAYITDAGSPNISDPGALLVSHARQQNIPIQVLGGISSLTTFMSGAGVLCNEFYFGGFFPKKTSAIQQLLERFLSQKIVGVWYESPHRVLDTMAFIRDAFPKIPVVLAKELTKPYEQFFFGSVDFVFEQLNESDLRGEWVMLLDGRNYAPPLKDQLKDLAMHLQNIGLTVRQVKHIAPLFDVNKNQLYDEFLKL
ncbi:MAG: 16S rRNA (cytidine(1402)-2'-O)-methyltransferase [Candidatus Margulisiibacteriota bacterium]